MGLLGGFMGSHVNFNEGFLEVSLRFRLFQGVAMRFTGCRQV